MRYCCLCISLLLTLAAYARPPSAAVQRWLPSITAHVERVYGNHDYVALHGAVVERESAGNPRAGSHAGAAGLMQIMPATFRELRQQYPGYSNKIRDPEINLALGIRYLHRMKQEPGCDGWRRALARYNCGPGCVAKRIRRYGSAWLSHVPKETRHYVPTILGRVPAFVAAGWPGISVC